MASKQHQRALAFIDTFKDLDFEANVALRTADCRHSFGPTSLAIPDKNNEQFAAHVQKLRKLITGIPVTPKRVFEGQNQVTIWATSQTIFRDEVKESHPGQDWEYHGEYVFVLTFNSTGDSIEDILEFLDSKKVGELGHCFPRQR